MSSEQPRPITDLSQHRQAKAALSVFAAAAAVVASEEAVVMREQVDEAEIAAAAAWASIPIDITQIFEAERRAWLEAKRAGALAVEHNRLARRSVVAATIAAQTLSSGLDDHEFATSDLMAGGIAALVAAKRVAEDSHQALIIMAEANFARAAAADAADGNDAA